MKKKKPLQGTVPSLCIIPKEKNQVHFYSLLKMRGRLSQKYLRAKENMKQIKIGAHLCECFALQLAALPRFD